MVSYMQEIYRKLLDSASFPGKLNNINNITIENNTKLSNGAIGIAITLLDQEVTFYIENCTKEDIKNIRALTMSSQVNYNKSDYLFLDINSELDILQIKIGSFEYPDESTTIIHQVNELSTDYKDKFIRLYLSGPGIKSKKNLYIDGVKQEFLEKLLMINKDYPTGADLILIDKKGEVAFIPRSSKLSWEVL
ncbi:phosphonate C-P lyase system protein PhnH [Clostridioides sp. ZZV15-6388]|uniref:phosphonate C-P lyase system protein PhnH n=1 Tax=unclassified Clostridioides TaxID=2635829 RepID=UPI001D114A6A|nr:phosphonate C-P lyase system protein PhnH [Clostridioides sp. ZZV15-6388]MCC0662846.1 phosphonate C-P lyase system protein PhnH [Clostridioides sp. ZZV15-6597]